jgi:hypothetical protein
MSYFQETMPLAVIYHERKSYEDFIFNQRVRAGAAAAPEP